MVLTHISTDGHYLGCRYARLCIGLITINRIDNNMWYVGVYYAERIFETLALHAIYGYVKGINNANSQYKI